MSILISCASLFLCACQVNDYTLSNVLQKVLQSESSVPDAEQPVVRDDNTLENSDSEQSVSGNDNALAGNSLEDNVKHAELDIFNFAKIDRDRKQKAEKYFLKNGSSINAESHQFSKGEIEGENNDLDVLQIKYRNEVFFATGSHELSGTALVDLEKLANAIAKSNIIPNITIVGHTDIRGSDSYNIELSHRRAESARRKLQELGIDENKISLIPMGERQPIASNSTKDGRSLNRRVEFFFSKSNVANLKAVTIKEIDPEHFKDEHGKYEEVDPEFDVFGFDEKKTYSLNLKPLDPLLFDLEEIDPKIHNLKPNKGD